MAYPTLMTTLTKSYNFNQTFPQITFCNINRVRRSYADKNPIILKLLTQWDSSTDDPMWYFYNNRSQYETVMNMPLDGAQAAIMLVDSAHTLRSTIHAVYFQGEAHNVSECFTQVSTLEGQCYTLDGDKFMVDDIGVNSALHVVLNVQRLEYMFPRQTIPLVGIKVRVTICYKLIEIMVTCHRPEESCFDQISEDGHIEK